MEDLEARERTKEDNNINDIKGTVPIYRKQNLTIKEAAEYSNIGINRLELLVKEPNCPFVLMVGSKKLIKRRKFDEYIESVEML